MFVNFRGHRGLEHGFFTCDSAVAPCCRVFFLINATDGGGAYLRSEALPSHLTVGVGT